MSYTQVFGGGVVYPSDDSYSTTALTGSIALRWPTEIGSAPLASAIMDVAPSSPGHAITMPSAKLVSVGENVIFNNIGSETFNVLKSDGTQIVSVAPGTVWLVYVTDNTTEPGQWRTIQYGASVSASASGALAGAGLVAAGSTLSQNIPVTTFSANYTAGPSDLAIARIWNGGTGSMALSSASSLGSSWFMHVRNSGSGTLTIDPPGTETIDGLGSIALDPGESCIVLNDGTSFHTVGRNDVGTSAGAFSFLSVPVPGVGGYTLSPAQFANNALRFTGALAGGRDVIVPNTTQAYYVDNQTTGPFPLTIKTAAGTGYTVPQGTRMIVWCDGTNVVDAVSLGTLGGVLAISQGGTGATTAGSALVNLGGTSLGINLFTSPGASAARAQLGAGVVGDLVYQSNTTAAAQLALGATPVGTAVFTAATPLAARTAIGAIAEDDALMLALAFG